MFLPKKFDKSYRVRMHIRLQRIDFRQGIIHRALRYKTRLIALLSGIEKKSRVVESQP